MGISMKSTSELVLTKLRPPLAQPRTIRRERLLNMLSIEPGIALALVCAPAGYGKTTLLVDWASSLRQSGKALAWVSLDESDNRPAVFVEYLVTSLDMAFGPASGLEPVRQVLRASVDLDLMDLLPGIINAVLSAREEVLLVLDDYHLIHARSIHRALEYILCHRPENLHLVIGSRANPPLSLARLRAQGRLIELRAADLRFHADETAQFLHDCLRLETDPELPGKLTEQVEGWAVGLQLAALSAAKQTPAPDAKWMLTGQHEHLGEYLLEEVINRLPEDLQSFLLYSALFDRFSAELCDAVFPANNSADQIKRLEQGNLFITALDEQGIWFRYHHLLRDYCRAWLERTQPETADNLHRAASAWFAGQGLLREAAEHAFRCHDWAFAADFVEQHSFTLIIQSDIATIYQWCSAFPEAVMRQRPRLCVFQALALAYRSQGKNRERVKTRLRQMEQALATLGYPEQADEVNEMAGVVRTFLGMVPNPCADVGTLKVLADTRLDTYPPGDPACFSWLLVNGYVHLALGNPGEAAANFLRALPLALDMCLYFGYVEASFHLAQIAHSQGRLDEALAICDQARTTLTVELLPVGIDLPALGCLEVAAGSVLLEQARLDEAGQHLRQGLERMGWGINPYYLMHAYLALFQLNELRGQPAEALACLDQLETLWPDVRFLTEGLRLQAQLRRHPNDAEVSLQAEQWAQWYAQARGEGFAPRGLGPLGGVEAFHLADLAWLSLRLALGQPLPHELDLETQLLFARGRNLVGREIEWLLVRVMDLDRAGDETQALEVLESAVTLGFSPGYRAIFCQTVAVHPLIHRMKRRKNDPAGVDDLMKMIRTMHHDDTATMVHCISTYPDVSALSERELEVLRIIACGASNQEIATRLVVTVGTVKGHINHILNKLEVANRTEAVAKARALGLLDR